MANDGKPNANTNDIEQEPEYLELPALVTRETGEKTLRHGVAGHYGLNTLEPAVKRVDLNRIPEAEFTPTLKLWEACQIHLPQGTTNKNATVKATKRNTCGGMQRQPNWLNKRGNFGRLSPICHLER